MKFFLISLFKDTSKLKKLAAKASFYCLLLFSVSVFISITASTIFFVAGIIFWIFSGSYWNPKFKALNVSVLILLLSQFLITVIHLGISELPNLIKDIFKAFIPWFWLTGIFKVIDTKKIRLAVFSLALIGAVVSILVFLQSQNIFLRWERGPSGFIKQPMTTSALLLLTIFIGLNYTLVLSKIKNLSPLIALGLLTALQPLAILIMGQRSTLLGLSVGLLIWFILNIKRFSKLMIITVAAFGSISPFLAYLFSARLRIKVKNLMDLANDKTGLGCRIDMWKLNWRSFTESPLIGKGKAETFQCFDATLGHAHNVYLNQLVTYGLIGLGALINFFVFCFVELAKKRHSTTFIIGLIALLIHGLFESWWGDSEITSFFWMFLVLGLV